MTEQSVEFIQLTPQIVAVLGILLVTICLFVFEVFRVDVVAILILVVIGLSSLIPNYPGLVSTDKLFAGFSSNAVISIIAVMILGAGLDKTGALHILAAQILKTAGDTERNVMVLLSATVGVVSGFVQNIGAAALFLPVVDRISKNTGIYPTRLLMPMGFCAILGGTVTLVGSSPLILLNDLILTSSPNLPSHIDPLRTYSLFSVTPIGLTLLFVGIVFFYFFGKSVLPIGAFKSLETGAVASYVQDTYGITGEVFELLVPNDSPIIGLTIGDLEDEVGYDERIIAISSEGSIIVEPKRSIEIEANSDIAIMGRRSQIAAEAKLYNLELKDGLHVFQEAFNPTSSGIAEVVVPPSSQAIGKSLQKLGCRRNFGVTPLAIYRDETPIVEQLLNNEVRAGDTFIVHSLWRDLKRFATTLEFVIVTDFPREDSRPEKIRPAVVIFLVTLTLVLFSSLQLSAALLTGAVLMILAGVIKIEEAYRSIGWQTVFLLASLIPLGYAVEETKTALWIAQHCVALLEWVPIPVFMIVIALLATAFTLVMSNVGATVLLVPIAINVAAEIGADPAMFALLVALSTSNSFLIPTHQVNALIQAPGGYRVTDFLRAGSVMTILFLTVVISMMILFYN